jgi:hypothetical protein
VVSRRLREASTALKIASRERPSRRSLVALRVVDQGDRIPDWLT